VVEITDANPFGSLSREKLEEFERQMGTPLPGDYKTFLLQYNGGRPAPSFFWIEPVIDGSEVFQFYGLHEGPAHLSIDTYAGKERYGIPATMLPIGDNGVGDFICLDLSAVHFGEVCFLDHEIHPFHDPDAIEGITKLANSFSEFLALLSNYPD
jgi:hypothetical protein